MSAVEQQNVFRSMGSDIYSYSKVSLRGKKKIKEQKWWKRCIQHTIQKVRQDFAVNKLINTWYNEGGTVLNLKMHVKSSHRKALQVQLTSFAYCTVFSHLYFIWCPSRAGDPSEPRRGKAQEPQQQAFAFLQANLELPSCASASSLLFNPKNEMPFERPQSKRELKTL